MESLLNILWALIAITAISVWRLRWVREERASRRGAACEWTAMVAALVLLFFAVSLSDDLRAQDLLSDECASGRRQAFTANCGPASAPNLHASNPIAVAILPSAISLNAPLESDDIATMRSVPAFERALTRASGRAPPVVHS